MDIIGSGGGPTLCYRHVCVHPMCIVMWGILELTNFLLIIVDLNVLSTSKDWGKANA